MEKKLLLKRCQDGVITYISAKWTVLNRPDRDGGFYAPWFGIESSDNLNLLQPVNPWAGEYHLPAMLFVITVCDGYGGIMGD